jgi:hypothetical protein
MVIYQPYTYLIGWTKHNKWYYGSETGKVNKIANPDNLWKTYFTSSTYVAEFREIYGEPDVVKVRKTFTDSKNTLLWEEKVLHRTNAVKLDKWLNRGNAGKTFSTAGFPAPNRGIPHKKETIEKISQANTGTKHSEETKHKISLYNKGRPKSEEHKQKIGLAHKGKKKKDPSKCASYGMLGKKLSPEAIAKRTESRRRNRLLRQHLLSIDSGSNI